MVGPDTTLAGGMIAAGSLFILNFILKYFLFRSKSLNRFVQGTPVMLVHKGIIIQENLNKEKISLEEIEAAAREHGVETIDEIDLAVLETDGNISVLSKNYQMKTVRKRKAHKVLSKTN
jgi:uncharacterized membrane protein YcaP (DUF421 family)